MKTSLKFEELLMLALSVYLFQNLDMSWWWLIGCFLLPDLGMLGYLVNTKIGAYTYNVFHHKGVAIIIYLLGVYLESQWLQFIGIILFGHASFDRALGYGLKYTDSFKNTHLGSIAKN